MKNKVIQHLSYITFNLVEYKHDSPISILILLISDLNFIFSDLSSGTFL